VEFKEGTLVPERLGEISKSLNLGRGYAEHWERYSCRELVQVRRPDDAFTRARLRDRCRFL
jgi:hypothetical protein